MTQSPLFSMSNQVSLAIHGLSAVFLCFKPKLEAESAVDSRADKN